MSAYKIPWRYDESMILHRGLRWTFDQVNAPTETSDYNYVYPEGKEPIWKDPAPFTATLEFMEFDYSARAPAVTMARVGAGALPTEATFRMGLKEFQKIVPSLKQGQLEHGVWMPYKQGSSYLIRLDGFDTTPLETSKGPVYNGTDPLEAYQPRCGSPACDWWCCK